MVLVIFEWWEILISTVENRSFWNGFLKSIICTYIYNIHIIYNIYIYTHQLLLSKVVRFNSIPFFWWLAQICPKFLRAISGENCQFPDGPRTSLSTAVLAHWLPPWTGCSRSNLCIYSQRLWIHMFQRLPCRLRALAEAFRCCRHGVPLDPLAENGWPWLTDPTITGLVI